MFYVSVTSPPLKVNDIWMSFFENHVAIVTDRSPSLYDKQFMSWTHWKHLKDPWGSSNHILGISHGPPGKPWGTPGGPRTTVWEPVLDPLETIEGPSGVPNHSLGTSHGPTGKPSGTTWGPRTTVWESVMDLLESVEGPLGVPEPQFGNLSWTPWKALRDHMGSPNYSLGTSHGPTGNPWRTPGGPRTILETHGGERHRYNMER